MLVNSIAEGYQHTALTKKVQRIASIIANGRDYTEYVQDSPSNSYGSERILIPSAYVSEQVLFDLKSMQVIYETLPEENNCNIFTATLTYDDSTEAVISTLLNQIIALQSEVNNLKSTINDLSNGSADNNITINYDDNGNLININNQ